MTGIASAPPIRILYGGTFDPVHQGHLAVADAASAAFDAHAFLVPSADPPHRAPPGASAGQRAAMLDLAIAGHPRLHVDRREMARAGPSYTVDTLREVRAEIGKHAPLIWLLGADAFQNLHGWHRWRDLFALAHLVVAVRPGHALDALDPRLQVETATRWTDDRSALSRSACGLLQELDLKARPEAASNLRERIASGLRWEDETLPAVVAYIRAHGLYSA
ncbi:MAG TPA: nicotinate-nucleotide adenylyltransferase [Xanthomonadaceae bacterium]|jgi:nicotinate-nucleotide adenylyltransferase|nr:nicotinate-nucleotide adenylyltransferase [Xanthomonadaceae bacterium]